MAKCLLLNLNLLLFIYISATSLSQVQARGDGFTPPPKPADNKPRVANGRVYFLDYIPRKCWEPIITKYPYGGRVTQARALMRKDNPHKIRGSIQIAPSGCLFIEPGCRLEFSPGVGLIVNGTLIARGSEEKGGRIMFTKDRDSEKKLNIKNRPWKTDARLVDGNTTMDGRLQVKHQGTWRGVCTNYVKNLSDYLLLEKPGCSGSEESLTECPGWPTVKIGLHICDGQQTVGFECEGLQPGIAVTHWRGIEFYNSSSVIVTNDTTNTKIEESDSSIWYSDIEYAGLDTFREGLVGINHPYASLSASPFVPFLDNVTIRHGAYDALNLTYILGEVHIENCTIEDNRGHGVFVKSVAGHVNIEKSVISRNWGDGVKYYSINRTLPHDFDKFLPEAYFFCKRTRLEFNRYPIFLAEQVVHPASTDIGFPGCKHRFRTIEGRQFTLHFMLMEADPTSQGDLIISYGTQGNPLTMTIPIRNGSYPQSITSLDNVIDVQFHLKRRGKCLEFKYCMRFLLRLMTTIGPDSEFLITESLVSDNNHHGVSVQDMKSLICINSTRIFNNKYEAGLRVFQGAGTIYVNDTVLANNTLAGANITISGGTVVFNHTGANSNKGYGIFLEFLKLNQSRIEHDLTVASYFSNFSENTLAALRVGNYCKSANILIDRTSFKNNYREAIEYLSCNVTSLISNFSVTMSKFMSNVKEAILMAPLLNTQGKIANNTFWNHSSGVIRINNGEDLLVSRWYAKFPVTYRVYGNEFKYNRGPHVVNIRLTEETFQQTLEFLHNKLIDNYIEDSFPFLKPRSKANAVIVVSSSKVTINKNIIHNRNSTREMATHLVDPSKYINAKENFWGSDKYVDFYLKIFDRDDRYNLAVITYDPALADDRIFGHYLTLDNPPDPKKFFLRGDVIGGELEERKVLTKGAYHVDKDIYIKPEGILVIPAGTVLTFDNSVGMIVYGALVADGMNQEWVKFLLEDDYDTVVENMTFPIRLADGSNDKEGRLEVDVDGEWGTVCNNGWTERNSVVACNQLGLVYNPLSSEVQQKVTAPATAPIARNWVSCTEDDTDLTSCLADTGQPQPIDCTHKQDVFLHCQTPTWSGITLAAVPKIKDRQETQIRSVLIDRAGMLDHSSLVFSSALQIDYNYYDISNLTVTESSANGIYIKFNHPYTNNRLQHCNVYNSQGNGLVTKYPFLETAYGTYKDNFLNGFTYDPFFTESEAMSVRNFLRSDQVTVLKGSQTFTLTQETNMFITEAKKFTMNDQFVYEFIAADYQKRPTIQILNYNPLTSVENVTVFDGNKNYYIEKDLIDFPVVSATNQIKVQISVTGIMSGRLNFVVVLASTSMEPRPRVYLRNCTLYNNNIGVVTRHYNNPSNEKQELYFRFREESIQMVYVNIFNSRSHAMHIPSVTKYHENFIPSFEELTRPQRVGTITYFISWCQFIGNWKTITAEHNHVEFSNNVWKWHISHCTIEDNLDGGLEIELPRVNDAAELLRHSVKIEHTVFDKNKNFAFIINGYFANVNITRSIWKNNICRLGLFDVTGMEKNISVVLNVFSNNVCKYIINFDVNSHFEYLFAVGGNFSYNKIYDNGIGTVQTNDENLPTVFAVALKGLQKMIFHRNLFGNPKLRYEFVAGITCLSLDNVVDVTENWWGSSTQDVIMTKIFDFDSWNNFGVAKFIPYLISNQFESQIRSPVKQDPIHNGLQLGGRISKDISLYASSRPYEVINDITVMPGVVLKIEPGVELRFRPNIGILVLGSLDARGLPSSRIKMLPAALPNDNNSTIHKRSIKFKMPQISKEKARLSGGPAPNEGFLQFFNTTTQWWDIVCNDRLPETVAEVICRQLGFETINVRVYSSYLFDYYMFGKTTYFTKTFWPYSYYCKGTEDSLDQCTKKIDYRIMSCIEKESYVYLKCGQRNLEDGYNYWGNIRFSWSSYEENVDRTKFKQSFVKYVDIHGAGVLHGNKVGAIQSVYQSPIIQHVNITSCASNGIDFISQLTNFIIEEQNITSNLGYGVNVLVLNGDSKMSDKASFDPLVQSTIPHFLFGVVEMCLLEKELVLETKMLIYYKYSSQSVDCIKSIKSKYSDKQLALRFLQINLISDDFMRNLIEIFDGPFGNQHQIGEIMSNSSSDTVRKLYRTSREPHTLTLHIHASVASKDYGFIAEIVTLPQSSRGIIDSRIHHTLRKTILQKNEDGAFTYRNVGEINPTVKVSECFINENGVGILNITSLPVIDIYLQNTKRMAFANNFLSGNSGGTSIILHTSSFATAIEANITNNLFISGSHGAVLTVEGHNYQKVLFYENYFFNSSAGDDQDIVLIKDVTTNFTSNFFHNNTAHSILSVYAPEMLTSGHWYTRSGFTKNNSTALYESTVKIRSGKPVFYNNYFVNPENLYEIEANPVSKFSGSKDPIEATNNWWGYHEEYYIAAKICDASNNKTLVPIDFKPYKVIPTNDGDCAPGWKAKDSRCFRFFGGVQTYYGAMSFCQSLGAELMESRDMAPFIQRLLLDSDFYFNAYTRVWVNKPSSFGHCGVFQEEITLTESRCHLLLLPFICESDPYIVKNPHHTVIIAVTTSIFALLVILLIVLIVLWLVKSKRRKEERLKRCASLRSSARSRSQMSMNWSKGSLHDIQSNISVIDTFDQTSINSIDKSKFNSLNTEDTEISPRSVFKPQKISVVPYSVDNGDDSDISFTDDESCVTEDHPRPQHNVRPANRYNPEIINGIWKEKADQQQQRLDQQCRNIPKTFDIYANLNQNQAPLSQSMSSLYSNQTDDKKPIINRMSNQPPSPPPPLYDYEPSEEFKNFSKSINQGSKDSLNAATRYDNKSNNNNNNNNYRPQRTVAMPKTETIPKGMMIPKQGRTAVNPPTREPPRETEIHPNSSIYSNTGSRENLADDRHYKDFQEPTREMSPQSLEPGVAYIQRNTFERGSRDRIDSPEPYSYHPAVDYYKPQAMRGSRDNLDRPQGVRGSRDNLDTFARNVPPPSRPQKPTPAPRPATRSRENLTKPPKAPPVAPPPTVPSQARSGGPQIRLEPESSNRYETDIF
ncbi:protein bark beetle-like [Argonauta hians]